MTIFNNNALLLLWEILISEAHFLIIVLLFLREQPFLPQNVVRFADHAVSVPFRGKLLFSVLIRITGSLISIRKLLTKSFEFSKTVKLLQQIVQAKNRFQSMSLTNYVLYYIWNKFPDLIWFLNLVLDRKDVIPGGGLPLYDFDHSVDGVGILPQSRLAAFEISDDLFQPGKS